MSYERMHGDGPCDCYERYTVDQLTCADCGHVMASIDEDHSCPLPPSTDPAVDYWDDEQNAAYDRWKEERDV